jgi:hypothetical protein
VNPSWAWWSVSSRGELVDLKHALLLGQGVTFVLARLVSGVA